MTKAKKLIIIVVLIIVLAAIVAAIYLFTQSRNQTTDNTVIRPLTTEQLTVSDVTVVHQSASFDTGRREVLFSGQVTNKTSQTATINVQIRLINTSNQTETESYTITLDRIGSGESITYNSTQNYKASTNPDAVAVTVSPVGIFK